MSLISRDGQSGSDLAVVARDSHRSAPSSSALTSRSIFLILGLGPPDLQVPGSKHRLESGIRFLPNELSAGLSLFRLPANSSRNVSAELHVPFRGAKSRSLHLLGLLYCDNIHNFTIGNYWN